MLSSWIHSNGRPDSLGLGARGTVVTCLHQKRPQKIIMARPDHTASFIIRNIFQICGPCLTKISLIIARVAEVSKLPCRRCRNAAENSWDYTFVKKKKRKKKQHTKRMNTLNLKMNPADPITNSRLRAFLRLKDGFLLSTARLC